MSELIRLPSGDTFVVRAMGAEDATVVRDGFEGMSPASLRSRFFSPVHRLQRSVVADLTRIDPDERIVLLALDPWTARLAGEVRAVRHRDDPTSADLAVTVADRFQGVGLGTELLRAMRRAALAAGVERLTGHVLVDNAPARALLQRAGATTSFDEPGVLRFELALLSPVAAPAPVVAAAAEPVAVGSPVFAA